MPPAFCGSNGRHRGGRARERSLAKERSKTSRERDRNVDPINVQTMHEKGQRIESLHMRVRRVMMQKNRGSRISNQPGRKRLGVKRSQVQVLSQHAGAECVSLAAGFDVASSAIWRATAVFSATRPSNCLAMAV
jgi:hypothetical protein